MRRPSATAGVAAVTLGFAVLSARQLVLRIPKPLPYAGHPALSAAWNEPPADPSKPWYPSDGVVPPPRQGASRLELRRWLSRYYPVLLLELPDERDANPGPFLELGGGPPRALFVEPGRGLVAREP